MSDYDNVIDDYFEAPARQAALSIDDSPDRAVRARQLSKATGQPQLAVYNDLDRADQEHKADLTRMIVGRNDKLSAYIRGEPLAAVVSNDDYGNLDNISKEIGDLNSISGITKHILSDVFRAPIKGAEVMAEQAMQPYWFNKNFPEFAAKNPYSTALYNLPEAALRTLSIPFAGIAGAAGEYAKTAVTAITADPMQGERAGRDIGGMVDYYFMGVTGHMPHTYGEMVHAKQFDNAVRSSQREFYQEALTAAKPYLDAGLEVPRGVHPLVDSIKANVNAEWVDKAEKVLNSSFDSATKERDPDLFHSYSKIEFEDSQMGISGDRVAALYGDKLPTPDDGLLGWVPGIKEKLEAARMFGEDVHVSKADWLTHMDPQLFKDLKDDIRAWPGGITKNEAALKDVAAPAIGANKEMTPIKEAVPEIEPRTLDERLDAYREEYRNMPEDATRDERGIRQPGLRDALDTVSSMGIDKAQGRVALDVAIKHGRFDIAEALVQRVERSAQRSNTTPRLSETDPKYNETKNNLERIKKEADDYAAELREKLNEAKLKNDTLIDGALPQTRAAAGLEPMFAIGDRKLELKKQPELKNPNEGRDPRELVEELGLNWDDLSTYEKHVYTDRTLPYNNPQHFYNFHDENGNAVGQLVIHPDPESKQLYVDWVGGVGKFGPSSFGPSLIRDIKRQLKEIYPEYESITGHRVSGARYNKSIVNAEAARLAAEDGLDLVTLPAHIADKYYEHAEATVKNPTDHPVVKLALGDAFELSKEYTDLRRILETSPTKFGDVTADLVPKELWTTHERAIGQAVQEEINRITGKTAESVLASDIRYEGIDGIRGVYHQAPGKVAKIIIALNDFDAKGIARHEAIHHLYREGFFTPEEWNALIEASKAEGWIERYGIADRYGHLNELGMHEEAIAEAFRDWARTREQQPINPVTTVFQKIWDLMQRIKDRVAEILGREPTFNELFEQAFTGELAQRGRGEARPGEAFAKKLTHDNEEPHGGKAGLQKAIEELEGRIEWYKQTAQGEVTPGDYISDTAKYQTALTKQNAEAKIAEATAELEQKKLELANYKEPEIDQNQVPGGPKFAKGEVEPPPVEERTNQLKAEAAGLDAKSFKRIQDLIQKRYQEDIAAAMKRAEAEQKTLQSKEWKEAAKEIRKEVEADIKQRPDVAADLLIGSGELGGKQLERKNYPLRAEDLTEAQKASLPRRYYSKDGVPVDMMANLFGFTSGDRLIEDLSAYTKSREGMSAQEGLRKTIDEEVQRRMEDKFGRLQDNIMLDAMDQALSETNLNILAEEWQGAAMAAGVKVVDKDLAKGEALAMFGKMKLSDINAERLLGIMGKIGRDTERLLIAGKNADALVLMQRKYMTGLIAAEARKLQKEQASAEKTFKQFAKREVKSMEPEYTDQVHDIMQRIGQPVKRSIQDLQESITREGYKNLADFVDQKQQALRVVDAWEPLLSGDWRKDYNSLTVEEFRGVHGTIKNLVHNGKEERKIYRAGEAAEFAELLPQFIGSIKDAAHDKFAKLGKGKYEKLPEQYFVQHIQMETFLNRLDGYDPDGVWFQYVYRDLADGSALVDEWRRHFVTRLKEVKQPENLHRTLDNPLFKDQDTNAPLKFTRRNLVAVMLNTGNSTNLKKLAEGYGLKSDDVMAWVHQHATKKEWDYAQHIWNVFKEIKDQSDTMYRSLSGVAPENIEIRPIDTPHGQYKGGYYPLIRDPNQVGQGSGKVFGKDALTQENFVSAMPAAGHTKKRTGAIYPIALEPDMMNAQMSQMLHDIGMRPAIINASKVFMNKEVQSAIRAHFGDAWRHELKDYLVGVANSQNYMPQNQRAIMELAEFARQNVISTVVGFNPGTVMKHGPTALFLSTKEVGIKNFAKAAWETNIFRNILAEVAPESYRGAVRTLLGINDATSNKAWNFIRENSLEIARRDRNWEETLFGASAGLQPFDQYATWRAKIMQWSSKPVALSDMLSAAPTWLAAYKEAVAAGKDHGEAVALGDRAVRRAHGSTASTSRTAFQRNYNPYLTSIYNFWSDILNRQVETIWKAGDEAHLTNGNPVSKGLATVPILAGGLFAYSIMPSIIEAHVSPHPHKDDEGFVWKSVKQLMFTQLGGWVGLRDAATAFAFARDPHYGLTGTAWQGLTNLPRDLMKGQPLAKERVGRLIQDGAGLIGTLTGSFPLQIGKSARYLYGVHSGQENPRNTWQWLVGLRFGTNDKHSRSFEEYMKGH